VEHQTLIQMEMVFLTVTTSALLIKERLPQGSAAVARRMWTRTMTERLIATTSALRTPRRPTQANVGAAWLMRTPTLMENATMKIPAPMIPQRTI
jgi:hypothetical protein